MEVTSVTMCLGPIVLAVVLSGLSPEAGSAEIAPGVHVVKDTLEAGSQPDGASVVFETDEGPVIVDTGRHPSHTRRVLDLAKSTGKRPVAIINTHWHLDHVSGNAILRKAYPDIDVYATNAIVAAREGFLANYRRQLVEVIAGSKDDEAKRRYQDEIERIDSGDAFMPTVVIGADREIEIGGRTFDLHVSSRAVTEADLWLFDRRTKTLVAGDLVTWPVPFLDTACPEGWRAALDELARADFEWLVPGHGAPIDRPAFERYREAFENLLSCAVGDGAAESCVGAWLEDASPLLSGDEAQARAMLDYYVGLLRSGRLEANCSAR